MDSQEAANVRSWRRLVELGSGRTGNVTLCIEPAPSPGQAAEKSNVQYQQHSVVHAVKRVRRKCMSNNGAARRVLQEKKALQALKGLHGIVGLRFTSKDDENLYFILEPLLGGPLHRHVRAGRSGHLEMTEVIFYASEVTSAIAHMHAQGFAHRDIKASNIVLDANGHAKVVDLGCSKQLEARREGRSHGGGDQGVGSGHLYEKTYTYCGTPHSMAPEMVSREGHGMAVDWWALGILIHEMWNGEPPFGYGGDGLPGRITAGLPTETANKPVASVRTVDGLVDPGEALLNDDDGGEQSDVQRFLPIVRRLLKADPKARLGSAKDGDEVMSHEWFDSVDWTKTAKLETTPPAFRKDLGELEFLEEEKPSHGAAEASVDVFEGF